MKYSLAMKILICFDNIDSKAKTLLSCKVKKVKKSVPPLSRQLDTELSKEYDNDGNAIHGEPEGNVKGRSH